MPCHDSASVAHVQQGSVVLRALICTAGPKANVKKYRSLPCMHCITARIEERGSTPEASSSVAGDTHTWAAP